MQADAELGQRIGSGFSTIYNPRYRPDAVFAIFFLRCGTSLPTSLKFNKRLIRPIQERYEAFPLQNSALATFIYQRIAWRDYTTAFEQRLRASYLGTNEDQAVWLEQQVHLSNIAKRCRSRSIPFLLVIFPLLIDLDDYDFHDVEAEIERFAQSADIPTRSLTPSFLGKDAPTLWVAPNNQHPNELGHQIAADGLRPYLRTTLKTLPGL